MSKKKMIFILVIFSLSIFVGDFIFKGREEKVLFGSKIDSVNEEKTESFDTDNKRENQESERLDVKKNNNKLDKGKDSTNIDDSIVIKKVQEYILASDYETGLQILKGLIVKSTDTKEEAEKTYDILKNMLSFGTSIIIENIDDLESIIEDILGESIDADGNVVTLDDKVQILIDKFKEVASSREVNEVLNTLKKVDLENLASDVIEIIREVDISK